MTKGGEGGGKENGKTMAEIVDTNGVASRPTATPPLVPKFPSKNLCIVFQNVLEDKLDICIKCHLEISWATSDNL